MSPEVAAVGVAALLGCGYLVFVVIGRVPGAAQRRRARFERDAVRLLLTGRIDRTRYHIAMAAMAAQDRAVQPAGLPRPQR